MRLFTIPSTIANLQQSKGHKSAAPTTRGRRDDRGDGIATLDPFLAAPFSLQSRLAALGRHSAIARTLTVTFLSSSSSHRPFSPRCTWPILIPHVQTTTMSSMSVDQWVEIAKDCQYLPENELKVLPPSTVILSLLSSFISSPLRSRSRGRWLSTRCLESAIAIIYYSLCCQLHRWPALSPRPFTLVNVNVNSFILFRFSSRTVFTFHVSSTIYCHFHFFFSIAFVLPTSVSFADPILTAICSNCATRRQRFYWRRETSSRCAAPLLCAVTSMARFVARQHLLSPNR